MEIIEKIKKLKELANYYNYTILIISEINRLLEIPQTMKVEMEKVEVTSQPI
jgi:hypothetical protein